MGQHFHELGFYRQIEHSAPVDRFAVSFAGGGVGGGEGEEGVGGFYEVGTEAFYGVAGGRVAGGVLGHVGSGGRVGEFSVESGRVGGGGYVTFIVFIFFGEEGYIR